MRTLFAISILALLAMLWAAIAIARHVRRARRRRRHPPPPIPSQTWTYTKTLDDTNSDQPAP